MNNRELETKVIASSLKLLNEKEYIAPVDLLLELNIITTKQYIDFKKRKINYLEKVCNTNLNKLNFILSTMEDLARKRNLKPSFTYYKKQRTKTKLQFLKKW